MCQYVHGSQYHAEAVEEGNAATKLVFGSELHMLTSQQTVVGYIIVRQHDTFRETCRTGSILHVDNIVAGNELLGIFQFVVADVFSQQ